MTTTSTSRIPATKPRNPMEDMVRSAFATAKPEALNDLVTLLQTVYGDDRKALQAMIALHAEAVARGAKTEEQRNQLLNIVKALKEGPAVLAYVLTAPHPAGLNGTRHRELVALPLARGGAVPRPFVILEAKEAEGADTRELPEPPYLGLVNGNAGVFLGPVTGLPNLPLPADLRTVVSAREIPDVDLGEIEVLDGSDQHTTLLARRALTQEIAQRLDDGDAVTIRDECGLATAIHKTDEVREEWVEEVPLAGPRLGDLKYPALFARQLLRDVDSICAGRPPRVIAIGSTGVGKTETVKRVVREVGMRLGRHAYLVRVSASTIGSKYIHETARNLKRALRQAQNLLRRGYVVAILVDECDALFGESDGWDHSHAREERLAFQELSSEEFAAAIYLTMNRRRGSWLPVPIIRRFQKRVYPRTTRSQTADVASLYTTDRILDALGMARAEFGRVFADMLFAEHRVVGTAHFHSGKSVAIRIRDLQLTCAGKTRDLISRFSADVEDGWADSLEDLDLMISGEFRTPELNAANLFDMTFLKPPPNDAVRQVEVVT